MTYNEALLDRKKRHPEKQKNPDRPMGKKPDWIRVRAPQGKTFHETRDVVKSLKLTTVCEEAGCPNIGECWDKKHATLMILMIAARRIGARQSRLYVLKRQIRQLKFLQVILKVKSKRLTM